VLICAMRVEIHAGEGIERGRGSENTTGYKILVVDDDEAILTTCARVLRQLPETSVLVENEGRRAAERLEAEPIDLLISDLRNLIKQPKRRSSVHASHQGTLGGRHQE
jgi:PleD family two-component response regulator